MTVRAEWVDWIYRYPVAAHDYFFKRRHSNATPLFHGTIIEAWHSPLITKLLVMAFRAGAKSTIGEEATCLQACLGLFSNCVILGENQPRAIDRLASIKHELMFNDLLRAVFGDISGDDTWGAAKIVLRNGVVIQALGRGQEVRGMKHLDKRPDLLFVDDLEAKEHVASPDARHETLQYFFAEVEPSLDKDARIRMLATPLDRESLPVTLSKNKRWSTLKFPIKYRHAMTGEWTPTWPDRYDMEWINNKEEDLTTQGLSHDFQREYMCEPEDPAKKIFTADMFKVQPNIHVWQPTYCFYDPARTTNERSSTTGWAVWSWEGKDKLIVWDGGGNIWKPDELIDHIFETNNRYHPVQIGVERDGLEEFLMQPIRAEMLRRGVLLPIEPMHAPDGKTTFIEGLQPFFKHGLVEFVKPMPVLQAQFLGFPSGQIDGPNALAYAPRMRPGIPVYEDFTRHHVVEDCIVWDEAPVWLALNSDNKYTTAVLCQFCDGGVHVIADFVREGDPGRTLEVIHANAKLDVGNKSIRCVAGPKHFLGYDTVGLCPAIGRIPARVIQGTAVDVGRAYLRALLQKHIRGIPAVQVGHAARWTINALASGYHREKNRHGVLAAEPTDGLYRVLMEGLESFVGLLDAGISEEDDGVQNYAYTATGQRYKTIKPGPVAHDKKSDWLGAIKPDRVVDVGDFPKSLIKPYR
jgi:hypothetical protein